MANVCGGDFMLKKFELQYSLKQKLDDLETLKDVMNGDIDMESLDNEVKIRLIDICSERLESIEQKIDEKRRQL